MHQLSNCLSRQSRHNVHQIIANKQFKPQCDLCPSVFMSDLSVVSVVLVVLDVPDVLWHRLVGSKLAVWLLPVSVKTRGIGKFDLWLIMRLMSFNNLIIPGHGSTDNETHKRQQESKNANGMGIYSFCLSHTYSYIQI